MKKILTAFLICAMTISLFGCNGENRTNVSRETSENEITTVTETTAAIPETPTVTEEPAPLTVEYDTASYRVAKLLQSEVEADRAEEYGKWSNIEESSDEEYNAGILCIVKNESGGASTLLLLKQVSGSVMYTEFTAFSLDDSIKILDTQTTGTDFEVYRNENALGIHLQTEYSGCSEFTFYEITDDKIGFAEDRFSDVKNEWVTDLNNVISDNVKLTYYRYSYKFGEEYYRYKDNKEYTYAGEPEEQKEAFFADIQEKKDSILPYRLSPKRITLKNTDFASFDSLVQALKPLDGITAELKSKSAAEIIHNEHLQEKDKDWLVYNKNELPERIYGEALILDMNGDGRLELISKKYIFMSYYYAVYDLDSGELLYEEYADSDALYSKNGRYMLRLESYGSDISFITMSDKSYDEKTYKHILHNGQFIGKNVRAEIYEYNKYTFKGDSCYRKFTPEYGFFYYNGGSQEEEYSSDSENETAGYSEVGEINDLAYKNSPHGIFAVYLNKGQICDLNRLAEAFKPLDENR